jgi:hypothetical protein
MSRSSPFDTSRQAILSRMIAFQNQTFDAGLAVKGTLHSILVAPGYQYDFIRSTLTFLIGQRK